METRSAKRKKLLHAIDESSEGEDRISDLPDVILHHILSLLPIRSIAQASVLSKRWRYIWCSYPDLDFTTINLLVNAPVNIKSNGRKRVHFWGPERAEFIDRVLALRDKQSDIRMLRFRACLSFSRLSGLIRSAVKHNVQELDIEVATNDYFNFPRSVIISESIRVLNLKSRFPGFRLPPTTIMRAGFRSLISLSLSRVILHDQPSLDNLFTATSFPKLKKLNLDSCFGLKHLKVDCRALEELNLENCAKLEHLEINCQKLVKLKVSSCFDALSSCSSVKVEAPNLQIIFWSYNSITENSCLENLKSLNEASIGFFVLHEDLSAAKLRSVSNFFSGVSHSQSLTLESQCVEILSKNSQFAGIFLRPFDKLKFLEIRTGFNKHNITGLASLFRSSPTIDTLIIKIINNLSIERRQWNRDLWQFSSSGEEGYWESQSQALKSFLSHLKVVTIHGFSECENDISLVKFFLKHGKVLQKMFLFTGLAKSKDSLHREKIKSQIMGFSRASSNANISFQ